MAVFILICVSFLALSETCIATIRSVGYLSPGFEAAQFNYVDNSGLFLLSNNSNFAFGFSRTQDPTLFSLVVVHTTTSRIVWTANRNSLVKNSDKFVFEANGNAYLRNGGGTVWSTGTAGRRATALELQDSGNLVLLGNDSNTLWESFSYPTDTLLSNQNFLVGMKLVSDTNPSNMSYSLEVVSGDLILFAGFRTPQPYWSMAKDNRKTVDRTNGNVYSAKLDSNSWRFYDKNQSLLWQFIFTRSSDLNVTWAAILGSNGVISFYNLDNGEINSAEKTRIPQDSCSLPESCESYYVCHGDNRCQCPSVLSYGMECKPGIVSPCNSSNNSTELVSVGEGFDYFALEFVTPFAKSDLEGCKVACLKNCSCLVLFFEESTRSCFFFDQIGSLRQLEQSSSRFVSYVKHSSNGDNRVNNGGKESSDGRKQFPIVVIIVLVTIISIAGILYVGFRYYWGNKKQIPLEQSSDEDNFWENLSGMPIRFSYKELETATDNFSLKLGQGGFGSVYQGVLPDGSKVAVKQLEGIGQGKKEFRAEVSIIGSIHHVHLVKLRGFCAQGTHRLLVYEYMENVSLDKWIFRNKKGLVLDWQTRFSIALGMAKGLAYLHEDCDVKIVHCDIKPENVLLDNNYQAKVSDFGLAKLMTREQSHVFTTLRGTRGYLAPEWITSYAISEKSDVYSFGMVFLEIIGGRKNFDPDETSEKSHFPSYVFKMMDEGKLRDVFDLKLKLDATDERVQTAVKVALWCIQEEMYVRPPMSKVVQMLEGVIETPQPPTSSQMGPRLHSSFYKFSSEEATSSGPSECYTITSLSDVQLSGPR